MERQLRILAGSAGIALVMYVVATSGEAFAIRAAGASAGELVWISDILLAAALGLVSYAWLHLRDARADRARSHRRRHRAENRVRHSAAASSAAARRPRGARLQPAAPIGRP